jgi:hypothetical protein
MFSPSFLSSASRQPDFGSRFSLTLSNTSTCPIRPVVAQPFVSAKQAKQAKQKSTAKVTIDHDLAG